MTHPISRSVASNIRAELARRHGSQTDIGAILGLSQSAVSRRFRGLTPFTVDELASIAEHLGLSARDLLDAKPGVSAA